MMPEPWPLPSGQHPLSQTRGDVHLPMEEC